jgi:hypothetical protein
MGQRLRLKRGYAISRFPRQTRIVLRALKRYGMILADNRCTLVRERRTPSRMGQRRSAFPAPRARQRIRGREHKPFASPA